MVVAGDWSFPRGFHVYTVYLNQTVLFGEISSLQEGNMPVLGAGLDTSFPNVSADVVVVFASKADEGYNQLLLYAHYTTCFIANCSEFIDSLKMTQWF